MDASEICSLLDADLVNFIHNVITLLKIFVPVVLVIFGMLDFVKGVMSSKEDEIKKGQQVFIKRLLAGFLVFFVVSIVQLVMSVVSPDDDSIWTCADQILNGTAGKSSNTGVTENGDDNQDPNSYLENKQQYEINEQNSGVTGVYCNSADAYGEYEKCRKQYGMDDKYCHTFLQAYCTSNNSEKLWNTASSYDVGVLNGISCFGATDDIKDNYKRQVYSCYVQTGSTNDALQKCMSIFGGYCYY